MEEVLVVGHTAAMGEDRESMLRGPCLSRWAIRLPQQCQQEQREELPERRTKADKMDRQ